MDKRRVSHRVFLFPVPLLVVLLLVVLLLMGSCSTVPDTPDSDDRGQTEAALQRDLLLEEVKQLLRIASPGMLQEGVSFIRRESLDRNPEGLELFYVADRLHREVYPLEQQQRGQPVQPDNSIFPRLFSVALDGKYPGVEETRASFLSLLVSSLSLLKAPYIYQESLSLPEGGEQASSTAAQLIQLNPGTVLPRYLLGRYSESKLQRENARSYYQAALDAGPDCYPAVEGLFRISFFEGDYAASVSYGKELLERFPGNLVLQLQLLEANITAKEIEAADNLLADMIQEYPENAVVVGKRPLILSMYGRFEQAGRLADALERSYGMTSDILIVRSKLLIQRNRIQEAVDLLERGNSRYGDDPFFRAMHQQILLESGHAETAQQLLDAGRGGQVSATALEALLRRAIEDQQWEIADSYLQSLESGNIRKPEYDRYEVTVARNLGQEQRALEAGRRLLDTTGATGKDRVLLADLLISFGGPDARGEAERILKSVNIQNLSFKERSEIYYHRSRLIQDRAQRLELLRSALLEDLQNVEALIAIARLHRDQGELKLAYRYYSQVIILLPEAENLRLEMREVEARMGADAGPIGNILRQGRD